jgi:hypothetical protein
VVLRRFNAEDKYILSADISAPADRSARFFAYSSSMRGEDNL